MLLPLCTVCFLKHLLWLFLHYFLPTDKQTLKNNTHKCWSDSKENTNNTTLTTEEGQEFKAFAFKTENYSFLSPLNAENGKNK